VLCAQFRKEPIGSFQIGGINALGEPVVVDADQRDAAGRLLG
jgi:hypothetical protein